MIKPWFTFSAPQPVWAPDEPAGGGGGGGDAAADKGGDQSAGDKGAGGDGGADKGAGGDQGADKGGAGGDQGASARGQQQQTAVQKEGGDDGKGAGDWPSDWRERLAGGDAKALDRLKRFPSPADLGKSYLEADKRINSGKVGADEAMPDPAKDADGAKAWREARGIPTEATGYELTDDLKKLLTDEDKPVLASYFEAMHKANVPTPVVQQGVQWYLGLLEQEATQRNAADKAMMSETEEALRSEWGSDFKSNREIARRYGEEAFPGVNLFAARLPDGRLVGNIPDVVKGLAKLGLAEYGDVTFAGGEKANAAESRMAELKKVMDTQWDTWQANQSMRDEYWKLVEADAKRKGSRAA